MTDRDDRPGQATGEGADATTCLCPECEGGGYVIVGWDDDAYENVEGDCDRCAATGRVPCISPAESAAVAALVAAVERVPTPWPFQRHDDEALLYLRAKDADRIRAALADPALARWRAVRTGEEGAP
jgi:hypothetical protein